MGKEMGNRVASIFKGVIIIMNRGIYAVQKGKEDMRRGNEEWGIRLME